MWETIKVGCVILYSQATMLIPSYLRNNFETPPHGFMIRCCTFNFGFMFFQNVLYRYLPSMTMYGSITPAGNTPVYRNNGLLSWFLTLYFQYFVMHEFFTLSELKQLIDSMNGFHWSLNLVGFHVSLLMYCRYLFNDEKNMSEPLRTGNFLKDFYKGIELHPRTFYGDDIKLLINSRFGMMLWGCIVFLVMYVSESLTVMTSGAIQLMYITKFFAWEDGYVKTSDITMDRCGYYLFWGCICYVPTFYTSPIIYHYYNPVEITPTTSVTMMVLGYFAIILNWKCDTYRTIMREFAESNPEIARKRPLEFIEAEYETSDGKKNTNWLISSGFYKHCRHPSYFFEILTTILWTLPGYVPADLICYMYLIFLTVLLLHRTDRIDKKCLEKYKEYWIRYKIFVPYKMIPLLY